jgi:hypothetical protein
MEKTKKKSDEAMSFLDFCDFAAGAREDGQT